MWVIQFNWLAWKHYKTSHPSFPYLVFFCNVGWEKISALLLLLNLKTNWQLLRSEALSCLALNGLGTTFTANFPSFLFHNEPKRVSLSVLRQWGISSQPLPYQPPREFAKHVEENMLSPLVVSTLQYPGTKEEEGGALSPLLIEHLGKRRKGAARPSWVDRV